MGVIKLIFAVVAVYGLLMISGFHKVREGYVGIYKNFGVLQKKLTEPGIHFRIPFYQEFIEMSVLIQTDVVTNIPCGTSNGTMVYFNKIEVVNRLRKDHVFETVFNYTQDYERYWITDKIHHEINQFCSKHSLTEIYIDIFDKLDEALIKSLNKDLAVWAPGIEIISIRVTKPNIPAAIQANFEEIEKKKIDYYIQVEKENVAVEKVKSEQNKKIIEAESRYEVKLIEFEKKIQLKENQRKMALIQAEMIEERNKAEIDTEFLASIAEAEMIPLLYTKEYLAYLASDAFTSNTEITVGDKVPNIKVGLN